MSERSNTRKAQLLLRMQAGPQAKECGCLEKLGEAGNCQKEPVRPHLHFSPVRPMETSDP